MAIWQRLRTLTVCSALVGLTAPVGTSLAAQSGGAESLDEAILEVWPDATEWTVEDTSINLAHLDDAVLVSLPPHQTAGRIDRYWTVRCEHRIDPAGWDCGRAAPYIRLRIRSPEDAETCLEPVPGAENRSDLPDDVLLDVVDYARHDPTLKRDLEAACETTWRPREVPFDEWRCAVASVSAAEGAIHVSRPAGLGCRSGMTLERSCQDGDCILTPLRCSMACA